MGVCYHIRVPSEYGSVPEWPKGTDCKSAGDAFGGSNPPAPTKTKRQFTQVEWRFVLVLFSFHFSLFTLLLVSVNGVLREKIREKREKKWSNPILTNWIWYWKRYWLAAIIAEKRVVSWWLWYDAKLGWRNQTDADCFLEHFKIEKMRLYANSRKWIGVLFWFSSLFTFLSSLFSEGSQTPYRFFLVLAVRVNNR